MDIKVSTLLLISSSEDVALASVTEGLFTISPVIGFLLLYSK